MNIAFPRVGIGQVPAGKVDSGTEMIWSVPESPSGDKESISPTWRHDVVCDGDGVCDGGALVLMAERLVA